MAVMAASSVFIAEGLSRSLRPSLHRKLHSEKGFHRARSSTLQRTIVFRTAASISTEKKALNNAPINWVPSPDFCKGWNDVNGLPAQRLLSQFERLSVMVSDRTEMHAILAVQRDNWNRLFHTTITLTSIAAAATSAVNATAPATGLQVVSIILGMGAAALMALVSKFQPSQLAEEQRHASRFFKRLGAEIEATLQVDPRLREDASCYWKRAVGTLHALDEAFPLPLTPVVLEKFPKQVRPSKLSGDSADIPRPEIMSSQSSGWTSSVVDDLKRTAQVLRTSDIKEYVDMANSVKLINLVLAITSPVFALAGVALNMAGCPSVAAALTVGSLFSHTLSHALQMGAVYEVYRNCAGYYDDVVNSIEKVLRLPVERREDAAVFSHKISLLLGRTPSVTPMVPVQDKKAGTLF